nr:hypothetical protein [Tanacetum cinerariifolium]
RLGKGIVSENMLMCCEPEMVYGLHLIRRISDESTLVVEIAFTWSLRINDGINVTLFDVINQIHMVMMGAWDQECSSVMVVPAVKPLETATQHQIPIEISMAQNQIIQTFR